jgi:hypothetical protein
VSIICIAKRWNDLFKEKFYQDCTKLNEDDLKEEKGRKCKYHNKYARWEFVKTMGNDKFIGIEN